MLPVGEVAVVALAGAIAGAIPLPSTWTVTSIPAPQCPAGSNSTQLYGACPTVACLGTLMGVELNYTLDSLAVVGLG